MLTTRFRVWLQHPRISPVWSGVKLVDLPEHVEGAAYLQDLPSTGTLPNYNEYSPELSRDNRGFRVWFPLALHGVAAFREALDEKLDLTTRLHGALSEVPTLEMGWAPQLTVVSFRLRGADEATNRELLARINASKRVFLSRVSPRSVMAVTLLPEPDSPTIPSTCPRCSSKLTPSTALTIPSSVANWTFRPSTLIRRSATTWA